MSNKLKQKGDKFKVVNIGNSIYRVKELSTGKYMTKDCPKDVADEIASDFNKMSKRDFTPIGMPDLSTKKEDIN